MLSKGHIITDDDARTLAAEGLKEVWITEPDEDEVGEDEAALNVAKTMSSGSVDIRLAPGGRANVFATETCCVLVDDEVLRQVNNRGTVAVATVPNFAFARHSERLVTVKSAPFAVPKAELEAVLRVIAEHGPVLQARPIRNPSVSVLYSDPLDGNRAKGLFESAMQQRLGRLDGRAGSVLTALEEEDALADALGNLLKERPAAILIASTTAPAGPDDVVGRAMVRAGCQIERFLAPVEPGELLLFSYSDDIPVVSAPGCFRSAKPNVLDLILPPLLARYRITGWEIVAMGHGGLLPSNFLGPNRLTSIPGGPRFRDQG